MSTINQFDIEFTEEQSRLIIDELFSGNLKAILVRTVCQRWKRQDYDDLPPEERKAFEQAIVSLVGDYTLGQIVLDSDD